MKEHDGDERAREEAMATMAAVRPEVPQVQLEQRILLGAIRFKRNRFLAAGTMAAFAPNGGQSTIPEDATEAERIAETLRQPGALIVHNCEDIVGALRRLGLDVQEVAS